MPNGVVEITEEIKTQLEIIEPENGQIEVISQEDNSIEISFSGSTISPNLDITTTNTTEIITIDNSSQDTVVNVLENAPTNVEITTENTVLDITERILLSGSFDLTFNNLIDNPFSINDEGKAGIGLSNPEFDLQVRGTLFSDIISSSNIQIISDGTNDLIIIRSQSSTPISINPAGIITFDNFQYTPTAVEGGFLYSGSEFYLGLE